MTVPVTNDGTVDATQLVHLSDDVWNGWLEARLRGLDTAVPGGTTNDPDRHLAIANLYDRLDVDQQRRLRHLLLQLLRQLHADRTASWPDDAAVALLRAIELLMRDSSDGPTATRLLLALLDGHALSIRVRQRTLQTLVGLGFHLSPGFWRAQYRDPSFGPTILEALGAESTRSAFEFLAEAEWTPTLEAVIALLIPSWVEDCRAW
jgi:hypothetical protein